MGPYLIRRILLIVLTLFGASVLVFSLIHLIPGDLVTILLGVSAAQGEATREALMRWWLELYGVWSASQPVGMAKGRA